MPSVAGSDSYLLPAAVGIDKRRKEDTQMWTIPTHPTKFQRELAEMAIDVMTSLFVLVESHGLCFDELVRDAIEKGEKIPREDES